MIGSKVSPSKALEYDVLLPEFLAIDVGVKDEEASISDWKRTKAKEWMGVLFGGLLECSEKGTVVATLGHAIIGNSGTARPGLPRAYFSGESQVEPFVVEVERELHNVVKASDKVQRSSNENHTGGIPRHTVSSPNPLVQPATLLPQPYVLPTLLTNSRLPPPDQWR